MTSAQQWTAWFEEHLNKDLQKHLFEWSCRILGINPCKALILRPCTALVHQPRRK